MIVDKGWDQIRKHVEDVTDEDGKISTVTTYQLHLTRSVQDEGTGTKAAVVGAIKTLDLRAFPQSVIDTLDLLAQED